MAKRGCVATSVTGLSVADTYIRAIARIIKTDLVADTSPSCRSRKIDRTDIDQTYFIESIGAAIRAARYQAHVIRARVAVGVRLCGVARAGIDGPVG